jgi:hypothetical protein
MVLLMVLIVGPNDRAAAGGVPVKCRTTLCATDKKPASRHKKATE